MASNRKPVSDSLCVDIIFCMDATGSMVDIVFELKKGMNGLCMKLLEDLKKWHQFPVKHGFGLGDLESAEIFKQISGIIKKQ